MRIGMRLLLGYFLIVAVAAWFGLYLYRKLSQASVERLRAH